MAKSDCYYYEKHSECDRGDCENCKLYHTGVPKNDKMRELEAELQFIFMQIGKQAEGLLTDAEHCAYIGLNGLRNILYDRSKMLATLANRLNTRTTQLKKRWRNK